MIESADRLVRDLFDRTAAAAAVATPELAVIGEALSALASNHDYLRPWIDRLGSRNGAVPIHAPERGRRLILVHREEGQMSAIHDHGTWVAISPIVGIETHRRWRVVRDGGSSPRVELAEDATLAATEVATMLPPNDVHDHGHLAGRGAPAYVLILLGDDQTRFVRNEWDQATGRHRVLAVGNSGRWLANEPIPDE